MKKYEYRVIKVLQPGDGLEDIQVLNEEGYKGWELVTVYSDTKLGTSGSVYFYFRKELG